jgi:3-phosphoshikimate 1-carboxyvinyltransferase
MRVRVMPGRRVGGEAAVPGDKSIAHRWLIAAATGRGRSRLLGLPPSLDVRSSASCLAALGGPGRPALEAWASQPAAAPEGNGSTWNRNGRTLDVVQVEGRGRRGLRASTSPLECGNSGTTMRLLAGVVASLPYTTVLTGDASLNRRPMERVARPLRRMGADVETRDGSPPLRISGAELRAIDVRTDVPSAQIKGAVLLAALGASGTTVVRETSPTRDHTERLFAALGVPVRLEGGAVEIDGPCDLDALEGVVPGDPSAAAFLAAAGAVTGQRVSVGSVGINPSRLRWLEVLRRAGGRAATQRDEDQVGEPLGTIDVDVVTSIGSVTVGADELPLVIDEVPMLAAVAVHAPSESRFEGGAELRLKESDRLASLVEGIRGLGGQAEVEGDDLVVAGGGLRGGAASAAGDHRIAMALVVAALAADSPCTIEGVEAADVSFPGFLSTLRALGAELEELP